MFNKNSALIVVDVQVDFCEGGALAVDDTLGLFQDLNQAILEAEKAGSLVIFTQDYHPKDHQSFRENGGIWPQHCVVGTKGVELHSNLYLPKIFMVVHKGSNAEKEGYSAFEDTKLEEILQRFKIDKLLFAGIATDYCVLESAKDSTKLGFETTILKNLTRAVGRDSSTEDRVKKESRALNIAIVD